MKLFHRVENCFGLTLCTIGRRIELWACFSGVPAHSHPGQHVEIVPLFGWAMFVREKPLADGEICPTMQLVEIRPRRWFHAFSIPTGWTHWFALKYMPLIFLNITRGPSAADNFVTT